jgi:hypothetical protein
MASSGTYTVCPNCDRPIDPNAPGVRFGREWVEIAGGFGGPARELVPGRGGYFHERCPYGRGWRPEPMPPPEAR